MSDKPNDEIQEETTNEGIDFDYCQMHSMSYPAGEKCPKC